MGCKITHFAKTKPTLQDRINKKKGLVKTLSSISDAGIDSIVQVVIGRAASGGNRA